MICSFFSISFGTFSVCVASRLEESSLRRLDQNIVKVSMHYYTFKNQKCVYLGFGWRDTYLSLNHVGENHNEIMRRILSF